MARALLFSFISSLLLKVFIHLRQKTTALPVDEWREAQLNDSCAQN